MILPPDTDKEDEALRELLAAPPAARLPPPPYIIAPGSVKSDGAAAPTQLRMGGGEGSWPYADAYGNAYANRASTSSIPYGPSIGSGSTVESSEEGRGIPLVELGGRGGSSATGGAGGRPGSTALLNDPSTLTGSRWRRQAWRGRRWLVWKRPARRTILVASCVALLILAATIGGVFGGLKLGMNDEQAARKLQTSKAVMPWFSGKVIYDPMRDGPPVSDGQAIECNNFQTLSTTDVLRSITFSPQGQNQSVASFTLPLDNVTTPDESLREIFINAYGDSVGGSIEVLGAEDTVLSEAVAGGAGPGEVKIDVVVRQGRNASAALVCSMQKDDGSLGVGVYTGIRSTPSPDTLVAPDPSLSFLVVVRFPQPNASTPPTYINNFRIQSSIMGINIGDMRGTVNFGNLTGIVGRGGVTVSHVAARVVNLNTQMSTLRGMFNVSESLNLTTTQGGLLAQAILHNPDLAEDPFTNTSVANNGGLITPDPDRSRSTTSLGLTYLASSLSNSTSGEQFNISTVPVRTVNVTASTTDGPLHLVYVYQSPGIRLFSDVGTTNGGAFVRMHSSFQGSFLVRSLNGLMRVPDLYGLTPYRPENADPWQQNRERATVFNQGTAEMFNLNGTIIHDQDGQFGNFRGNAIYNAHIQSWEVSGASYWLTQDEISNSINMTQLAGDITSRCNTSCTGIDYMRDGRTTTTTSWGDATLSFTPAS